MFFILSLLVKKKVVNL